MSLYIKFSFCFVRCATMSNYNNMLCYTVQYFTSIMVEYDIDRLLNFLVSKE